MQTQKFYPWTMHRHWGVWDGQPRPHSLWIFWRDAAEMALRLASLAPDQSHYRPFPWEHDASISPLRVIRVQREVDHG